MVGLTNCQSDVKGLGEARRRSSLGPDENHIPHSPSVLEGIKFNWHGSKEEQSKQP